jgi:hypothetical protein
MSYEHQALITSGEFTGKTGLFISILLCQIKLQFLFESDSNGIIRRELSFVFKT